MLLRWCKLGLYISRVRFCRQVFFLAQFKNDWRYLQLSLSADRPWGIFYSLMWSGKDRMKWNQRFTLDEMIMSVLKFPNFSGSRFGMLLCIFFWYYSSGNRVSINNSCFNIFLTHNNLNLKMNKFYWFTMQTKWYLRVIF